VKIGREMKLGIFGTFTGARIFGWYPKFYAPPCTSVEKMKETV